MYGWPGRFSGRRAGRLLLPPLMIVVALPLLTGLAGASSAQPAVTSMRPGTVIIADQGDNRVVKVRPHGTRVINSRSSRAVRALLPSR